MKNLLLLFILSLFVTSCNKPNVPEQAKLPDATTTGANTFGCNINGQVFYPRDGVGNFGGGPIAKGIVFWGDPTGNQLFDEIDIGNYRGDKPARRMIIHLQGLDQIGVGEYVWHITNFYNSIDGPMQNYVYCEI